METVLTDYSVIADKTAAIEREIKELRYECIKNIYEPHVNNRSGMTIVLEAAEAQCRAAIDALEGAKDLCSVLSSELGMQLAQERQRREAKEE